MAQNTLPGKQWVQAVRSKWTCNESCACLYLAYMQLGGQFPATPWEQALPDASGASLGRQCAAGIGFGTAAMLQHECVLVPHAAVNLVLAFLP
jgi:hypothetical protein